MNILGINAYHGDVSAVLLRDGALVAAVEEERFRRVKHWAGFPQEAIRVCLEMAGITPEQVDHFAVSRDPKANQRQKALFVLRHWPSPRLILDRGRNRRQVQDVAGMLGEELGVRREAITGKVNWVEHHPAHLASAFFASPFEEAAFHVLNALYEKTRLPRLCLAGGCAMNSVMNGKIRERTPFKEVYIQPASGDNGTALGAALYVQHHVLGQPRRFVMEHGYWGPEFGDEEIGKVLEGRGEELKGQGCEIRKIEDEEELCRWTAERIAEGKIVGWFQGRMEWGPAPLGIGASWPIHGGLTCARSSTRRSSSGRGSGRSHPR